MSELTNRMMQGRLSITKVNNDGSEEKLQEFNNIPVQGLGYSLARLFSSKSTESKLDNFRFAYFQVGTGFINYMVQPTDVQNAFYALASALPTSSYGSDITSVISQQKQLVASSFQDVSGVTVSSIPASLVKIPASRVTRVGDSIVKIKLVVDQNMAVGQTLEEIGLFIRNPDESFRVNSAILAAYKYFSPVPKTNQFSLVFDWVIQLVDITNTENWNFIPSAVNHPPFLSYDPINIDASSGFFSYSPLVNENLRPNSYSITQSLDSGNPLNPAFDFDVSSSNGDVYITIVSGSNESLGKGHIIVEATPTDTTFGNSYTTDIPFNISWTGGITGGTGPGGTGIGFTGDTGGVDGSSTGDVFRGPRIGAIDWVVPYTGASYDYSTSQVVVLKAIMPTSYLGGDFRLAPGLDKWMVVGGSQLPGQFITVSSIAQVESVTRDPSGYPTNVEVIFSALVRQPTGTPEDGKMSYQTFGLYQASGTSPSSTLSLSSLERLHFSLYDPSGNLYACNFFTSASSGVTFNPNGNPSITSSLVKDGPFLKTYRFYGRTVPRGYAGEAGHYNPNDPDHEIKPFGPGIHAYVTVRLNQPVANVDFRISNASIHRPGYAGGLSDDPISYEPESSYCPGFLPGKNSHVIGNFYFSSMFVDFGANSSGISYIDKWDVNLSSAGKYTLVSAFPVNPNPLQQAVHCITPTKALVHRFGVFRNSQVSSLTFAKHEARGHYQAFPQVNSERSYQAIRAWGPRKEYLPAFPEAYFPEGLNIQEYYWHSNGLPGIPGQRRLVTNAFNYINNWWSTQLTQIGTTPQMGLGYDLPPRAYNSPWTFTGEQNPAAGAVELIDTTMGSRQLCEEYDYIETLYEGIVPRQVYMFNVSGQVLTTSEIVDEYNPGALTDNLGYLPYYQSNPGVNSLDAAHSYPVEMGSWISSEFLKAQNWPSWFVRALSNSRVSQPNTGAPNLNSRGLVTNNCPYIKKICVTIHYLGEQPFQQHDTAHTIRSFMPLHTIAFGRNDPMAKEDLQAFAEITHQAVPHLLLRPTNRFFDSFPGEFVGDINPPINLVPKFTNATSPQFSGTGVDLWAHRGSGWIINGMASYYAMADNAWRTRTTPWFNYVTSAYSLGWQRNNGYFSPGDILYSYLALDGGNTFTNAPPNVFFKRITDRNDNTLNPLVSSGAYWKDNPITHYNAGGNDLYNYKWLVGTYNDGLGHIGGTIAVSSTGGYTFHNRYILEGLYSLVRNVIDTTQQTHKQSILSGISKTCSSMMSAPIFGAFSGQILDPVFLTHTLPSMNIPSNVSQLMAQLLYTNPSIPQNRERGIAYSHAIRPIDYIYENQLHGYGSGVGQQRDYSFSAIPLEVNGNIVISPDGGYSYGSRNRSDMWELMAMGIAASLGDNDMSLSSQSILSANFFVQKAPQNLSNDYDVLTNPVTSQFFASDTPANIQGRTDYAITNLKNKISQEYPPQGLRQCAHYLAYLLKVRGLI